MTNNSEEYPKEFIDALAYKLASEGEPEGLDEYLKMVGVRENAQI